MFQSFRATASAFARRLAVVVALTAAAATAFVIAAIYALSAAHAALSVEIGAVYASLGLAVGLVVLGMTLLLVAKGNAGAAHRSAADAARMDVDELRRKSEDYLRLAARASSLPWSITGLRILRAIPWRVALGLVLVAGAIALLWPHLKSESTRKPGPAVPDPGEPVAAQGSARP